MKLFIRVALIAATLLCGLSSAYESAWALDPPTYGHCLPTDALATWTAPPQNNVLIFDGQMTGAPAKDSSGNLTDVSQEKQFAGDISASPSGFSNAKTQVAFRTVLSPTEDYTPSGSSSSSFAYYNATAPFLGNNYQAQYWDKFYKWYYTAASSDFITPSTFSSRLPLFGSECADDEALRKSNNLGLYLHEVVVVLSNHKFTGKTGDWDYAAAASIAMNKPMSQLSTTGTTQNWPADSQPDETPWQRLDYWAALAQKLGKKIVWSEPAEAWAALGQDASADAFFTKYRGTVVPMFATNFESPTSGRHMGQDAMSALYVAQKYGMPLGESVQSWYFREQTDLPLQRQMGLPTANAFGTGNPDNPPNGDPNTFPGYPGTCCNLDPINTNGYLQANADGSVSGPYSVIPSLAPPSGIWRFSQPSLTPTDSNVSDLAQFGWQLGTNYFQVEGAESAYKVANQGSYPDPNDMTWPLGGAMSAYLHGVQQFSAQKLAAGSVQPALPRSKELWDLFDTYDHTHYMTTATDANGYPLDPQGTPIDNTKWCSNSTPIQGYCKWGTMGDIAMQPTSGAVKLLIYKDTTKTNTGFWYRREDDTDPIHQPPSNRTYALFGNMNGLGTGVVGYVQPSQKAGTEPLYWMEADGTYTGGVIDNYFTSDPVYARVNALQGWQGYRDRGVVAWINSESPATFVTPTSWQYGGEDHAVDTDQEAAALGYQLAYSTSWSSLWSGLRSNDRNYMLGDADPYYAQWAPKIDTVGPNPVPEITVWSGPGSSDSSGLAGLADVPRDVPNARGEKLRHPG